MTKTIEQNGEIFTLGEPEYVGRFTVRSDVMIRKMLTMEQMKSAITNPDVNDNVMFADVIFNASHLLRVEDKEIRREFGLCVPTLTRWKDGRNAPGPQLRKVVYDWLKSRLP